MAGDLPPKRFLGAFWSSELQEHQGPFGEAPWLVKAEVVAAVVGLRGFFLPFPPFHLS